MSYSYVQRGGVEEFHPFDYLGFRYFQIDDPGETLTPADVVARTRHAAVPDEHAATFASSSPGDRRRVRARASLGAVRRHRSSGSTPRPARRARGCGTGSTSRRPPWWRSGSRTSPASRCSSSRQSQHRFWAKSGSINKIYPTGLGAEDINEYTEIYPEWVWQYWMRTGDRALLDAVYPVLVNIAGYVDTVHRPVDRARRRPAGHEHLLRLSHRDPAQRAGCERVPARRRRRRGRSAGPAAR